MKLDECIICYLSPPSKEGRGIFILNENVLKILKQILEENGNGFPIYRLETTHRSSASNAIVNILFFTFVQFKIIANLIRLPPEKTIIFFSMGFASSLPLIISKIKKFKTIYFISGLAGTHANSIVMSIIYKQSWLGYGKFFIPMLISFIEKLNYNISDSIFVESPNLINQIRHDISSNKLILNASLFVDKDLFYPQVQPSLRKFNIGFIGSLVENKGFLNFIEAIPIIIKKFTFVTFIIVGTGSNYEYVKKYLKDNKISNKIIFCGHVHHNNIAKYLNEIKLLVLPSYGEGLPNIILEALACGTPVLATPVGGISDIIKDEITGFIMETNSPECIAANIFRAFEYSKLDTIGRNARLLIEQEYTYDRALNRWRKNLAAILCSHSNRLL